jgi:fused signal recognition particle receptor
MSEGEKRGLLGRWFKGKQPAAPAPVATPAAEPTAAPEPMRAVEPVAVVADPAPIAVVVPVEPVAEAAPIEPVVAPAEDAAVAAPVEAPAETTPIAEPAASEPVPQPLEFTPAQPVPQAAPKKVGWWQKLKSGLSRTSSALGSGISAIFTKRKLDDDTLDELEDILIQADLGLSTATRITDALRRDRYDKEITDAEVRAVLAAEVKKVLEPVAKPLDIASSHKPHVVLVVGVNGSGKTTTIGKMAMKLTREGKSVTLCAGDTFRAAAIEQLKIWGGRTGASVIAREPGADAASLAFDALAAAKTAGSDVLIIDTAGRLQNRTELMAELEKVVRVIKKQEIGRAHV